MLHDDTEIIRIDKGDGSTSIERFADVRRRLKGWYGDGPGAAQCLAWALEALEKGEKTSTHFAIYERA